MSLKPCKDCGEPVEHTRCPDCAREVQRPESSKNREHVAFANLSRWKNLSKRVRRIQPWCDVCGTDQRLQANHVISTKERPDLTYAMENLSVLCAKHNGGRGRDCTPEERAEVERRLTAKKSRRHADTRGEGVSPTSVPMSGEAQTRLNTPGRYTS